MKSMNALKYTFLILPLLFLGPVFPLHAGEVQEVTADAPVLTQAIMCEAIDGFKPRNPAVVFSIDLGKIFCFTAFEHITEATHIYHKWFQNDHLISRNRLILKPPQWSTISSMQLRTADRGPWYVEITDKEDVLLQRLRFSISE